MPKKSTVIKSEHIQELLDNAWLRIPYLEKDLYNPVIDIPETFIDDPHMYILSLLSHPDYFPLFCKEILNLTILPFQAVILHELWVKKFPILIASRGAGKSFLLGLYALLRMIFMPGRKIVITGAGFRQSKIIFEYIENIWYKAPLLRSMVGEQAPNGPHHINDMWTFHIGESKCIALPIGVGGDKIRGQRAHDILVDEFAVGNEQVFEHVISGFAAVSADPIANVQKVASQNLAKELGYYEDEDEEEGYKPNQIILSGTAYYSFNHFYKYFKKWHHIISSRGDKRKLIENGIDSTTNWLDYSIIRLPYDLIPKGFMEDAIIARARSSMHKSLFGMEFMSEFGNDSNGFFKRSTIEKCVNSYSVCLEGNSESSYVIAVDPASENDNFCIVVVEITKHTRRVVYCWTTTRKDFNQEKKRSKTEEEDFYDYASRKILDLVNTFNVIGIAVDMGGGGRTITERLHSSNVVKINEGEQLLWPIIDPEKPTDEDYQDGRHIIECVQFSDSKWLSAANHGMRLDFETESLLFPKFDAMIIAKLDLSADEGIEQASTIEEVIKEIEEMKNELSSIVMTQTETGREHWDTPDQKTGSKKGYGMRKDRYSALLMANALAKKIGLNKPTLSFDYVGGFARRSPKDKDPQTNTAMYICNAKGGDLAKKLNQLYGNG